VSVCIDVYDSVPVLKENIVEKSNIYIIF